MTLPPTSPPCTGTSPYRSCTAQPSTSSVSPAPQADLCLPCSTRRIAPAAQTVSIQKQAALGVGCIQEHRGSRRDAPLYRRPVRGAQIRGSRRVQRRGRRSALAESELATLTGTDSLGPAGVVPISSSVNRASCLLSNAASPRLVEHVKSKHPGRVK